MIGVGFVSRDCGVDGALPERTVIDYGWNSATISSAPGRVR